MRVVPPSRRLALAGAALVVSAAAGCMVASRTTTTTEPATTRAASMPGTAAVDVPPGEQFVAAATTTAAGEYLTIVGGCNDCHTPRWGEANGNVPNAERFTGNPVGYRGPWGTTYAANLRLFTQRIPEDSWVRILKTAAGGHGRPPMPWMNTARMSERDLRAMYQYIRALGPAGERTPRSVPPGQQPTTPYVDFTPRQPGQ